MQTSLFKLGQRVMLAVLFVFAGVSGLLAQTNTTALSGTVTDSAGLKLPATTVTMLNTNTGETYKMQSKAAGEFEFPQVVPGHYTVTAEHQGFSQQQVEADLEVATPQVMNFKLSPGSSDTVVVEAPMVSTTLNQVDASLGKAFNNTQIQELPYLANNTLSLLALQPGVVSLDANNTTDTRAGTINGARQDQTNITLDGTDNNDANNGYAFTGILRATRDSIEEFRVTTSGSNADAGRSSGAQVSLQTKSGTNSFHGSAYYYYRDPAMASNNWFNKQTQLASAKPNISAKVLQDTYGATLGAPILKDKLFFFGAYEGYKQASDSVVTATVPGGTGALAGTGAGLRNGTLSYLNATGGNYTTMTPAQIAAMDPLCTAQGGCPAGPGVNAAVISFFNKNYPVSNTSGGDNINTGGFSFVSPQPISLITNIARLDYIINHKQVMFVRGNLQSDNQASTIPLPGGTPGTNTYGNNRGITGGHIWNVTNSMTNNFRFGWTRQGTATRGAGGNFITFAAVSLPFSTTASTILLQNTLDYVDDFTIVKGKHTMQFGINDRFIYNHRTLTKYLFQSGTVTANDVAAGGVLGQNTSLDINNAAFASLGLPKANTSFRSSYNSAVTAVTGLITIASAYANYTVSPTSLSPLPTGVVPPHEFRSVEQEYYGQDQWKIMPKLTLTVGLRLAHLGVPTEVNGQQVRPQTSMTNFLNARIAAMNSGTNYNVPIYTVPGGSKNNAPGFWFGDTIDPAPRLAFNYAPDPKTSIRGGFMLTYDHFGQGAVNTFNDSYSFGLSSPLGRGVQGTVDADPRYTTESYVPPSLLLPPPPGGNFPILQTLGSGGITQTFDDSLKTPYAETFNLSVQRQVMKGMTMTATYTGRLGRHQLLLRDIFMPLNLKDNASGSDYFTAMAALDKAYDAGVSVANMPNNPYWSNLFPNLTCKGASNPTQAVYSLMARSNETATLYDIDVPNGLPSSCADPGVTLNRYFASQYGSLDTQSTVGSSNYNGGQLSMRHTVNRSIVYDFNYTFAKSMDMGSSPERSQSNYITNTFAPRQMYADSSYDVRHLITADWIASLPYGRGQRYGANASRLMDTLLGGWQFTGVLKYSSAFPWTSSAFTSGWGTNWEIQSSSVEIGNVFTGGHHAYYPGATAGAIVGSAFGSGLGATASAGSLQATTAFRGAYVGESGQRNNLRADGYFSMDPGLSKTFKTFEGQSFKLIVEYFNVTNATRFGSPGSGSTASTFGQYTSGSGLLNSPRQAQIAGRYYF